MIRGMGEEYVLGHRAEELARLDGQAKMLEPATRLALQLAGIGPGMRVVDLGHGHGRGRPAGRGGGRTGRIGARRRPRRRRAGVRRHQVRRPRRDEHRAGRGGRRVVRPGASPVGRGAGPAGPVLPAGPGGHHPAAAGRAQTRVASTWRSSTTPSAVRSGSADPGWSTRLCRDSMNAAFAAAGHAADAADRTSAVMLRERRCARTRRASGCRRTWPRMTRTGPAMLAAVIGSLVPAIDRPRTRGPRRARHRDPARADRGRGTGDAGCAMIVPTLVAAWGHPG